MPIKTTILFILLSSFPTMLFATEIERPIIPSCESFYGSEQHVSSIFPAETNEEQWNKYYRNGHSAIRLGLVYKHQGRSDITEELMRKPYKIYELGYIPLDQELAKRLAWLVSEYLGLEKIEAANDLLDLISELKLQQD